MQRSNEIFQKAYHLVAEAIIEVEDSESDKKDEEYETKDQTPDEICFS